MLGCEYSTLNRLVWHAVKPQTSDAPSLVGPKGFAASLTV